MKKTLTRVFACVMAALIIGTSTLTAEAEIQKGSYTYTYDYFKEVQETPDFYSVTAVVTSTDLGLDKNMSNATTMYVHEDHLFVVDSGNNRILELERDSVSSLKLVRIIDSFKGPVEVTTFADPSDIAISEDGNIFIADKGNNRIVKLDSELNYLLQFDLPNDDSLSKDLVFKPSKIVVDTAERVYCCAIDINKGLVKYEADGTFSGFVGATPVAFDFWDYIWKKFATQEQRKQMEAFVPTQYDNIYMDRDGFIYTITTRIEDEDVRSEKVNPVRKINLLGNDILIRNGEYPIYGDLFMGTGGGHTGASQFADITVLDNDIYVCVDQNRGRLFGYNDQGELVFAFGGNGNMDGYFKSPTSVEHIDYDLFVLDPLNAAITIFIPSEFGKDVYEAVDLFNQGKYTESGEYWEKVMALDGNYDLAYIGIGRSLLRQKRYKEAMNYFELKYDDENYSKAYKQYRKVWVEENIAYVVIIILALFLIPGIIKKVKSVKYEVENADIFKA